MNQAQREYLTQYCQYHKLSQEEAMEHMVVKDILEQLENKADTQPVQVTEITPGCNCS